MSLFFFIFVDNSRNKRRVTRNDLKCIACNFAKKRCDLVIFVQDEYTCNMDTIQKLLSDSEENDENRVRYICQKCSQNLKRSVSSM